MIAKFKDWGARWISLKTIILVFLLTTGVETCIVYLDGSYNNYLVFTRPIHNLISCRSLYEYYCNYYEDVFRYSPSFALTAGCLAWLPNFPGLLVWNLLNTVVFLSGLIAFFRVAGLPTNKIVLALFIVYLEWLNALQNSQSNGLVVGLILWALVLFYRGQNFRAAALFALSGFIKFYSLVAAIMFIFFPKKIRFLFAMILWIILISALPLFATTPSCLLFQYQAWLHALISCPVGHQMSVMGILQYWFELDQPYFRIQLLGLVCTLMPLIQFKQYASASFQNLILASILLFVVIFNPMAESPTYIIALTGAAIWFCSLDKIRFWDMFILVILIGISSNINSDLYPKSWRIGFFIPYSIKAVPCLICWLQIQYLLWSAKPTNTPIRNELLNEAKD
jgi:hypothetical protein